MTISEKKMQIVIDNYFKSECDVNTSIRQAFEKGFRIGINKLPSTQPEIIRCKDCKHRPFKRYDGIVPPKEDDWKCPCLCDDYFYSWIPEDNFFCANGERREE